MDLMKLTKLAVVAGSLAFGASAASAATYKFDCITGNIAGDCAIGESQLTMEVGLGSVAGNVLFTFSNAVAGLASSITQIYWESGMPALLADITAVTNGPSGVDFEEAPPPPPPYNLPGGNPIAFVEAFKANADSPVQPNGVNPGEWVSIEFSLLNGAALGDLITQLNNGALRVGIHVQGFGTGGSESFVNKPECIKGSFECPNDVTIDPIPVPATLPLLAGGLALAGFVMRRRRKDA